MEKAITIGQAPINSATGKLFYIMSEGYRKGHYIDAMNVTCKTVVLDPTITKWKLSLNIYEFTPVKNSSDICLALNSKDCTSGVKMDFSKVFDLENEWDLKMELRHSTKRVPEVRFWVKITCKYYLL